MACVYIAPLSNLTAFKVGKAIAPSSRLSHLMRYYEFNTNQIIIIDCKTSDSAFALEAMLHKACESKRVVMPYDGGMEFFSYMLFNEAVCIASAICRINDFKMIPFVIERRANPINEASRIAAAVAGRVRARRLELNLSQAMVAKLASVGCRTIQRIERAGQSTLRNLAAVLMVLNLEHLLVDPEVNASLRKRSSKSHGGSNQR